MKPPELRDGVDLSTLARTCGDQASAAGDVIGSGPSGIEAQRRYLVWHENTEMSLMPLLGREEVAALLLTPRHWSLRSATGDTTRIYPEVQAELTRCTAILREWAAWSHQTDEYWRDSIAVIPDTDYLLHCGKRLPDIEWASEAPSHMRLRVVLTVTVLDQIDRHKRGKGEVRTRARLIFKEMREMGLLQGGRIPLHHGIDPQQRGGTIEVLPNSLEHSYLSDEDSEIVSRAEHLSAYTRHPSIVLTYDGGMAARTFLPNVDVLIKTQPAG